MKIYKLDSLTTFLFSILIIGLVVFLPVALIEALWNSTIGRTYNDITINFWQALILWLIVLITLNILGVLRFEFAVEAGESLDKDVLKKKLESIKNLQGKNEEPPEAEGEIKKDTKE